MNIIESIDNKKIKQVKKLANKKYRDNENKYVIEGINLVSEAISKGVDVDYILVSENFNLDLLKLKVIKLTERYDIHFVKESIFNKIGQTETSNSVIAVLPKPKYSEKLSNDTNVLVLDKIQDPGNIGALIRTAVAFKYEAIILIKGTVDVYSPKVLRATAGTIFSIKFIMVEDAVELQKILKENNKRLVATVVKNGNALNTIDRKKDIALVIGNEGNGISKEVLKIADDKVSISLSDNVESLNAAVAAGIIIYELHK